MAGGSKRGPLIAGLILIAIGVIFFIENWYARFSAWRLVARYWPLIPIIIGINKLYGYFSWVQATPALNTVDATLQAQGVKPMPRRRPSLLGGLLWLCLGLVFLLRNFGIGPDFWTLASRYWPILLILLGLGKIVDYFRHKQGVSLRFGEVFGILFLFLIGSAISGIHRSRLGELIEDMPVRIGDSQIQPGKWIGNSYSYSQEVTYPLDNAATPIRIENSHGLVSLSPGSEREVRVRLRKIVYQNEESKAKAIGEEIKIQGGPEGTPQAEAVVKPEAEPSGKAGAMPFLIRTNRDDLSAKDYRFDTDMEVFVPRKAHVQVLNSFGEVKAVNLEGKLDLSTTHNPLEVRDCSGNFNISNKYAETRLVNLTGNVTVDARGRVYLETIRGDVNVQDEYSPVEIHDITGPVTVSNTESSIHLEKVTKPVVIDARGSQVVVRGLDASLKLTTSHRQLQIADVGGDVTIQCRYANATIKNIRGNVDIDSVSDRLSFEDIRGFLKVKAQGTGVQANSITGPIDITTTLKPVNVNNFQGSCNITDEYADVTLSTPTLAKGDVTVKNRNGGIRLFLPEDSSFNIDAIARNGRIDSEFPGLVVAQASGDDSLLKGKAKTGAARITLETEYNNIQLRAGGSEKAEDGAPIRKRRSSTI